MELEWIHMKDGNPILTIDGTSKFLDHDDILQRFVNSKSVANAKGEPVSLSKSYLSSKYASLSEKQKAKLITFLKTFKFHDSVSDVKKIRPILETSTNQALADCEQDLNIRRKTPQSMNIIELLS